MFAYVGTRTTKERNARGEGISVYRVQQENGALELIQLVGDLFNPSFLALNSVGDRLYTVHGDGDEVSAFTVNKETGHISYINSAKCGGKNPVHLTLSPFEKQLIVSNHLSHNLSVIALCEDGSLGEITQIMLLAGDPGPHRKEQPFSKPHFNPFDPSGRFVVVPDKGLDRIFTFVFEDGSLKPTSNEFVTAREASGPRHLAFHPKKDFCYVVNELDSTVTSYTFDQQSGELFPFQVTTTLPDFFTGNSRASEIEIDASGRFLYASNRGYDSVAVYEIAQDSGRTRLIQIEPTLGKTPRFFAISPSQRYLYILNEDSDSIMVFSIDPDKGKISYAGINVICQSPVCMVFSMP